MPLGERKSVSSCLSMNSSCFARSIIRFMYKLKFDKVCFSLGFENSDCSRSIAMAAQMKR